MSGQQKKLTFLDASEQTQWIFSRLQDTVQGRQKDF